MGLKQIVCLRGDLNGRVQTRFGGAGCLIHVMAYYGGVKELEFLLEGRADIESRDEFGGTPLVYATYQGNANIVRILLSQGAAVDKGYPGGKPPLCFAAQFGHLDIARNLLAYKASLLATSSKGVTPLHSAAEAGEASVASLLIESKASLVIRTQDGRTPLRMAGQQFGTTKMLLEHRADPNSQCINGVVALHDAAFRGCSDVCAMLLHSKSDLHVKSLETKHASECFYAPGSTALHLAAQQGHHKIIQMLLGGKADVQEKNKQGRTAKDHAQRKHHHEVVKSLQALMLKQAE